MLTSWHLEKKKKENSRDFNDDLYTNLIEKNGISFWKNWNSINKVGNSISSRINGETKKGRIAESFAKYFESVYDNNSTSQHNDLKREFCASFSNYFDTHKSDSLSPHFFSWSEMVDVASKIKIGKSTAGPIRPENILNGAPELMCHFHLLFNSMLQHSYAPTDFLRGIITPIVKDSQGDLSDTSNYRGITLSTLPAKLFELALQAKISHLLHTDELQFGFKRKTSTSHALFTLKSTIDHFNSHGSKVYVAFLDCTKAFDRISHDGLFLKLIQRKIPLCFLLCLMYWYRNMTCNVKWENETSRSFNVPLGMTQGGINSPDFFSCYIDDIVKLLRTKEIGCKLYKLLIAIILFADDMCLLAPTRSSLQKLINLCSSYCDKFCLSFNPKKSKIMVFSPTRIDVSTFARISMNGVPIDYANSIKYLGVTISSQPHFAFDASNDLKNFFCSSNSILNVLHKPDDCVLLHLLYSNCVPTLTYACAVKYYSSRQMQECNTALNNAIRKIFTYNRWESIRTLRENFGYLSLTEIFNKSAKSFRNSLPNHSNSIIKELFSHLPVE